MSSLERSPFKRIHNQKNKAIKEVFIIKTLTTKRKKRDGVDSRDIIKNVSRKLD